MLKCWFHLFKAAGGLSHRHFCWGLVYTVIHTSTLFITVQDKEFIAKAVDLWTMLILRKSVQTQLLQILLLKTLVLVWSQKTRIKKVDE